MNAAEPKAPTAAGSPGKPYYPALDGLRAIAVLMVFTVHYLGPKTPLIGNWGLFGVDLFFVLSGFLITGILYDSRGGPGRFRSFYARRALRIFPLYYGVCILILAAWWVFRWRWTWAWLLWPIHLGNLGRFLFVDTAFVPHLEILYATRHTHWLPEVFVGHSGAFVSRSSFTLSGHLWFFPRCHDARWCVCVRWYWLRNRCYVWCLRIHCNHAFLRLNY